jgi:hypothetical protein
MIYGYARVSTLLRCAVCKYKFQPTRADAKTCSRAVKCAIGDGWALLLAT